VKVEDNLRNTTSFGIVRTPCFFQKFYAIMLSMMALLFSLFFRDAKFPEMKHSAGAKIISHCNCGRKQGYRDEPFTIREANFAFYNRLGSECCDKLENVEFPIFAFFKL